MCGGAIPEKDKRATQHDLCLPCKGSRLPAHCPYRAGDRVVMTASPRAAHYHPRDHVKTGFRGTVEGAIGATLLIGLCDDGQEWCQSWGSLDREPACEQLELFPPEGRTRAPRPRRKTRRRTPAPATGGAA
jgi:hypothetical protein